jgi:NTP pyrophosphatase (non-canonical NTP hydrolase)
VPSLADGRLSTRDGGEVGSVRTGGPGTGGDAVDIRAAQKLAWENKLAKGFNTTDVPLEFCLLSGEIAEAFDAWRKSRQDVAEELADTAIFLLGLAEMIGADLQEAVEAKLAANEARVYRRLPNGVLVKDAAASQRSARPLR